VGTTSRRIGFTAAAAALAIVVSAQTPASLEPPGVSGGPGFLSPARTPDGRPDLQGTWYFGSATPLERPKEFEGKPILTPEEAAAFEEREADRLRRTPTVHAPEWLDYGTKVVADLRSSLIIDPPDGRVPALTPEARERLATRAARRRAAEDPEAFSPNERCIVFGAGPPVLPGPYNNNLQIVQTRDTVVVVTEMIHDARIVPLDGRPPPPSHLRSWLGFSRGTWEGETLVIETTQFTDKTSLRGSDEHLRVVERFSLEGPDALRYEFTIDNPTAFTGSWRGAYTMTRTAALMYEFACHEGNYGLANMLQAARYEEKRAGR
jgi:hypothetical protein